MKHVARLAILVSTVFCLADGGFVVAQNSSLLHAAAPEMIPAPYATAQPTSGVGRAVGESPNSPGGGEVVPPEYAGAQAPRAGGPMPGNSVGYNPAVNLKGVSWTYQQAPPLRQFRIQDIVTIRVDEIA
ncbi:MAG: flagellar basal body L-ring protein FlgH, partial [Rhodopirellula sp. JB044]